VRVETKHETWQTHLEMQVKVEIVAKYVWHPVPLKYFCVGRQRNVQVTIHVSIYKYAYIYREYDLPIHESC
jgi:hypothetical protein